MIVDVVLFVSVALLAAAASARWPLYRVRLPSLVVVALVGAAVWLRYNDRRLSDAIEARLRAAIVAVRAADAALEVALRQPCSGQVAGELRSILHGAAAEVARHTEPIFEMLAQCSPEVISACSDTATWNAPMYVTQFRYPESIGARFAEVQRCLEVNREPSP